MILHSPASDPSFAQDVGQEFGLQRGVEGSKATHQTVREYYTRAHTPTEPDFSLPERHRGSFLGAGRESNEEWLQRVSTAVSERIRAVAVPLLEDNIALERRVAQLEGALEKAKADLDRVKEAQEVTRLMDQNFGLEGIKAIERGEVVQRKGWSADFVYKKSIGYLEAREAMGENHRDARHSLHGIAVSREHKERELARGKDSGLDFG